MVAFQTKLASGWLKRHLHIPLITTQRFRVTSPIWMPPDADFPDLLDLQYESAQSLRYGENPHQRAAFYRTHASPEPCAAWANQLSGQPLSFNNILDLEAAIEIVKDFSEPACVIIKHNNPVRISDCQQFGRSVQRCP